MNMNDPIVSRDIGDACDKILSTALKIDAAPDQLTILGSSIALLIALSERQFGKAAVAIAVHRGKKNLAAAVAVKKKR
ncbi:hypothetical protein CPT_Sansa67 [Caulobacter phage Sansa]|uniref:Uncharacterized protein n=1 Tax=Caulobacter phage Sansa TaxID=1675600 RepID=A0A0K1LLU3_9CAUD|nr:hypothetical protein HOR07_gp067 [Caulobacter phage Sansa]AKU43471.1 hypothetical protein CPT_Sansa67 [Caulobacter phage Sansa]